MGKKGHEIEIIERDEKNVVKVFSDDAEVWTIYAGRQREADRVSDQVRTMVLQRQPAAGASRIRKGSLPQVLMVLASLVHRLVLPGGRQEDLSLLAARVGVRLAVEVGYLTGKEGELLLSLNLCPGWLLGRERG